MFWCGIIKSAFINSGGSICQYGEGVTYFSTEKRFIQVEDYSVSEGQLRNLYHDSLAFLHRRQRRKVSHCQCKVVVSWNLKLKLYFFTLRIRLIIRKFLNL